MKAINMQKEEIKKIIERKIKRQQILKERLNSLKTLENDIKSSKISRWFGNAYLVSKKITLIILSLLSILFALILFFFPAIVFDNFNSNTAEYNEINSKIQLISILFLLLGFVFIYIARLTQKMYLKNQKIKEFEKLAHAIINDYSLTIEEEERELNIVNQLLNTT